MSDVLACEAPPNNSLNPTGISEPFIREAWRLDKILPGGVIRALGVFAC